jgi:hypothetical protein
VYEYRGVVAAAAFIPSEPNAAVRRPYWRMILRHRQRFG